MLRGPVETLKWPAMTMNFIVKDEALLGKLSAGNKVDFEFVQEGRGCHHFSEVGEEVCPREARRPLLA